MLRKEESKANEAKQKLEDLVICKTEPKTFLETWGILTEIENCES